MSCPFCGASVPVDHVVKGMGMAECPSCNGVFQLDRPPQQGTPAPPSTAPEPRDLPPPGLEIARDDHSLIILHDWPRTPGFALLATAVVMLGPLLSVVSSGVVWSLVLLLIVEVVLVAMGIAFVSNQTSIIVAGGELHVGFQPVPWFGGHVLATDAIDQLYVASIASGRRSDRTTYELRAMLRGGTELPLVTGITDRESAMFIEQALERQLGVVDRSVPGERRW